MGDEHLSLAAYGLLCRLLDRDEPTFTAADVRALEPGGMSKARATRLIMELRSAGHVCRTRGGYVMDGIAAEQWEPETTPALAAASYAVARCA